MSDKFIHYKCETLVVKNPSFQVVGKVTCVDCKEVSDIQMGSINATESPKTVTIKCQHCQKVLDISSIVDDDKLDDHRLHWLLPRANMIAEFVNLCINKNPTAKQFMKMYTYIYNSVNKGEHERQKIYDKLQNECRKQLVWCSKDQANKAANILAHVFSYLDRTNFETCNACVFDMVIGCGEQFLSTLFYPPDHHHTDMLHMMRSYKDKNESDIN